MDSATEDKFVCFHRIRRFAGDIKPGKSAGDARAKNLQGSGPLKPKAGLNGAPASQFAENVSKAEALSAEIASIYGGARGTAVSQMGSDLTEPLAEVVTGKAYTARR